VPLHLCFAVKSNSQADLLRSVVVAGVTLDVSSVRELRLAQAAGAGAIVYTGPAKTAVDFDAILQHPADVLVHIESERELRLLSHLAGQRGLTVRCGIRIQSAYQGGWTKFGVPLTDWPRLLRLAGTLPGIDCTAVHFHISTSELATDHADTLRLIAATARHSLSEAERARITVIDIGGGFFPPSFEGIHSWNPGQIQDFQAGDEYIGPILADTYRPRYQPLEAIHIEEYAEAIAAAYRETVVSCFPNATLAAEPGSFIAHSTMHMLLTLVDLQDPQRGIADGGTNMVGWEKYQYFSYVPTFNLTQFSLDREIPFLLYGSLCTPDDIWSYYLHCSGIAEGDTIVIPYQGAYTHTLAQEFIRGVPDTITLG
jgi:diaminopimelate decarboxylase